jgi:hypothetical protein
MHNLKRIVLGFSILLASIITFSSCDDGSTSAYTGVRMIDNTFSPPVVRVHEGGLVRFYNAGNNPHNVIATDAAWGSLEDVPKMIILMSILILRDSINIFVLIMQHLKVIGVWQDQWL